MLTPPPPQSPQGLPRPLRAKPKELTLAEGPRLPLRLASSPSHLSVLPWGPLRYNILCILSPFLRSPLNRPFTVCDALLLFERLTPLSPSVSSNVTSSERPSLSPISPLTSSRSCLFPSLRSVYLFISCHPYQEISFIWADRILDAR